MNTPVDLEGLVQVWKPTVVVLQWSLYPEASRVLESCTAISVNEDSNVEGVASVCVDETRVAHGSLPNI